MDRQILPSTFQTVSQLCPYNEDSWPVEIYEQIHTSFDEKKMQFDYACRF